MYTNTARNASPKSQQPEKKRSEISDHYSAPVRYTKPGKGDKYGAVVALGRRRDLTASARIVGITLVERANHKTGRCHPSIDRLIQDTDLCRRAVFAGRKELRDKGLIDWVEHGNLTRYVIHWERLRDMVPTAPEEHDSEAPERDDSKVHDGACDVPPQCTTVHSKVHGRALNQTKAPIKWRAITAC
jgi:hypothetical protein